MTSRGREAQSPSEIPARGWLDIAARIWQHLLADRAGLAAAAVTFYLFLAIVPALAILVSVYGLYTDPSAIEDQVNLLTGFLPQAGLDLIHRELERITGARTGTLSLSLIVSFLISLWSANNAVRALFQAMNVAYKEQEKRNFFSLLGLSLSFTFSAVFVAIFVINLVVVAPIALSFFGLSSTPAFLGAVASPLLLFVIVNIAIASLYRWGPSRKPAKWRWITWGSFLASLAWMAVAAGFAGYLANWANYGATYGSLGTIIGLMFWIYFSAYVVIVGAEIDAEIEHQTSRDSTIGPDRPMGSRGAVMADTIGEPRDD